jgi:hypothetical protein
MVGAHEGGAPATPISDREKCMRTRGLPTRAILRAATLFVLMLVLVAATAAVAAASSPSPAPVEDQPLVDWTWLGLGLGGVALLLVVMYLMTRFFGNRQEGE